jgi:hypothetical protein
MLKLIIGVKGTGKTKHLIELVNASLNETDGAVVCIEKGNKLRYDIKYQCRLIEADEYSINDTRSLYGFIAGMLASNSDITHLYVDSALRICGDAVDEFDALADDLNALSEKTGVNFVMTSSIDVAAASDTVKKYL